MKVTTKLVDSILETIDYTTASDTQRAIICEGIADENSIQDVAERVCGDLGLDEDRTGDNTRYEDYLPDQGHEVDHSSRDYYNYINDGIMTEQDKIQEVLTQCPNCDTDNPTLEYTEDFDVCTHCGFEGWSGDFKEIHE